MSSYATTAEFVPTGSERWILILGGVTRLANRRARRIAVEALEEGIDVVWFDGFEEQTDGVRVPLEVEDHDGALWVVGYSATEAGSLAGRLNSGSRMASNRIGRALWKTFGRRLGRILRPRAGWKAIRSSIRSLANGPAPRSIVYCDVYAITSAWHSARLWPKAPILSGGSEGQD